jgi:hypothetical protein
MAIGPDLPHVRLTIPLGWRPDPALDPPDLSQAIGVRLLNWEAWAKADASAPGELVAGCWSADPGTWTPEIEPLVLERLTAMVSSVSLRIAQFGEYRALPSTSQGNLTSRRLLGSGDSEHRLSAQIFLGFAARGAGQEAPRSSGTLVGCFALCTMDEAQCGGPIEEATVAAQFVPPPGPTLSLSALVAMVHHPTTSLGLVLTFALLVGAGLVVTRRRPRTK